MKSKRTFGFALCAFLLLFCAFFTFRTIAVGEDTFTLSLSENPKDSGTFQVTLDGEEAMDSGELSVKKGTSVTVKIMPSEGFAFDFWLIRPMPEGLTEADLKGTELSFAMPGENVSIEAYFQTQDDKFTVFVEPNDFGRGNFVESSFDAGQTVTVNAIAHREGYRFVQWVDLNGALKDAGLPEGWEKNSAISFTMPSRNVVLSPEFEPITYYLTLKIVGEGDAAIVGKEMTGAGKYECTVGETLELSALPGKDFVFVNWSATHDATLVDADQKNAAVVCPASDFTVTANFASSVRKLTVKGTEGGTVYPEPGEMNVGAGNIVSLIATPNEGYAFDHWECSTENGKFEEAEDSDTNFTMPEEDCTITAVFRKGGYQLTLAATAGGEAKGKEALYEMGDKVSIEAVALEGYVFSYWKCSVSGAVKEPRKAQTQVTIPGEPVKVTAVFVLKASLVPDETVPMEEEKGGFPWVVVIIVFILTAIVITLVVLREQLNLSYRYLVGKWYEKLIRKFKKK